ncbi:cyclin-K isoform X2 [Periplaneta americana]|uniref:cyclin-K isoform X2 n=1 Tax=Periplaneta americana TaxID=6978 RepID=UPI0037E959A7
MPKTRTSSMPCWYYEKKELRNTPSIQDGIDYETECRYRKEGARFIIDTGTKMDLGYNTMATGVVYFHRFYMFHSFRNFPRYVTACCCLFLAGKVEETPKKCKDIIKTARSLLTDQKFLTFGEDPKEEVMTLERILLQTIKFDLQVEHPYGYLLKYAKCLKGDKTKLQKMVQMAWTFVNDSLCTTLSLQWEPEVIAVALMYLAGKLSKFEVVDWSGRTAKHLRWWDMFVEDVTMDLLEDICHQVLDLYSQPQTSSSPDSPPLMPSTRSPTVKKERMPQPISPVVLQLSPVPSAIPVKVSKDTKQHSVPSNGEDKGDTPVAKGSGSEVANHYQYGAYSHSSMTPTFPPTYTTPLPVSVAPPAPAPNTSAPPPTVQPNPHVSGPNAASGSYNTYPPQYSTSQYYQGSSGPPSRPYYPPPGGPS